MNAPADIIQFPVKRKRGRPKGSKNKTYRPNGAEIQPKQTVEPRTEGVIGEIDNVKHYCYEIMQQTSTKGRPAEMALVGLLHWFKVNYL